MPSYTSSPLTIYLLLFPHTTRCRSTTHSSLSLSMGRAPCCEKIGLKKGRWTAEEDEILIRYIQANGQGSWRSLPKNAGLSRCGKSCRLRWINYLRADLKRGNISTEEEDIIIKLHSSLGKRWSLIAGHLPGRTDNEIKNYWNSHLSRRIQSFTRFKDDGEVVVPMVMDVGKIVSGHKRKGGRTSKPAMKKNSKLHEKEVVNKNEERDKTVTGSCQDGEVAFSIPIELKANDVMCPEERIESGFLSLEGIENGVLCCTEEVRKYGDMGGISDQERENGGLSSNEESDQDGFEVKKEETENGGVMGRNESEKGIVRCSSLEEMGCLREEWLDWEWDGDGVVERKDGGEKWSSWLWNSDNDGEGEGDCLQEMGCEEEEKYAAWLLSTDTNDL